MKIYVDQCVCLCKRLTFGVDDDCSMDDIIKELKECSYIEEFADGPHCSTFFECEYIPETELLDSNTDPNTEVLDANFRLIDSWHAD